MCARLCVGICVYVLLCTCVRVRAYTFGTFTTYFSLSILVVLNGLPSVVMSSSVNTIADENSGESAFVDRSPFFYVFDLQLTIHIIVIINELDFPYVDC